MEFASAVTLTILAESLVFGERPKVYDMRAAGNFDSSIRLLQVYLRMHRLVGTRKLQSGIVCVENEMDD